MIRYQKISLISSHSHYSHLFWVTIPHPLLPLSFSCFSPSSCPAIPLWLFIPGNRRTISETEGSLASKEGQNRNLRWQRVLLGVCNFVVGNNKSKKEKEGNIYLDLETYCKFNKVWAVVSVLSKWGCLSFCI